MTAAGSRISSAVRRPGLVPAVDLDGLPGRRPGVDGGRADQPPGALLLEDVRRPATGARTGEHRREHVRGHLGEVEDDRRPELHVGLEHPVGAALLELGQRGLLQRLGDLVARRVELLGGTAQHPGARVLGAVDAVAEAHQPLALVEQALDVRRGVAALLHVADHPEHPRRRTAVQRAAHRADGAGERGGDVGTGRGDHPGGERRGVHAVLGGGAPVGVDRLDVLRVRLALPADHEPLGEGGALVDLALRDDRLVEPARGLRGVRQHHHGDPAEVLAGLLVGDVVGLAACRRPAPASRPRPGRRRARRRCAPAGCRAPPAAGRGRRRRRSAAPRPSRTGCARRSPRCRHRGSAAPSLPCPARRSRSRRRRLLRVRGEPRSCCAPSRVGAGLPAVADPVHSAASLRLAAHARVAGLGSAAWTGRGPLAATSRARSTPARGLAEDDLAPDPFALFRRWFEEASPPALLEPNAMVLSTVAADGRPVRADGAAQGPRRARLRLLHQPRLAQGRELAGQPALRLLFPWHPLQRQVRVEGAASRCRGRRPRRTSPPGRAAPSSAPGLAPVGGGRSRDGLEASYADAEARFAERGAAARPTGAGTVVRPRRVEFWQGRPQPDARPVALRARRRRSWRTERLAPETADAESSGGGESLLTVIVALIANALVAVAKSVAAVITGPRRWSPRRCTRGPTRATRSSC